MNRVAHNQPIGGANTNSFGTCDKKICLTAIFFKYKDMQFNCVKSVLRSELCQKTLNYLN